MKKYFNRFAVVMAVMVTFVVSSCSDSGANPFGSFCGKYADYLKVNNELKEKAQKIETQEDKARLIAEQEKIKTEWSEKLTKAAEKLNGRTLEITGTDFIEVITPITMTFKELGSSSLAPIFTLEGEAKVKADINGELSYRVNNRTVYLVGYNKEGEQIYRESIGEVDCTYDNGMYTIPAGTSVNFKKLRFDDDDAELYPQTATLKLEF
ncbi:MAG: hypothetical protein J1E63_08560 [Muribaculaceae bacterium]|nr:hypothetical protein [Muribaculaceae bacterium]